MPNKTEQNQRRDAALQRMLRTPPQPKTAKKGLKDGKNSPVDRLGVKSLGGLEESGLESEGRLSDPMPTDDPIALIEWGKRNVQRE